MTSPIVSPKKYFHNDCIPTIKYQKHSLAAFSRPDWAAVSEPMLEIAPIELIFPIINWTLSMFHKVNHQYCGWLRCTVNCCCDKYGLIDDTSPWIACFFFDILTRSHFHSTIYIFLWLRRNLSTLCMMTQMEVTVIMSLNTWDSYSEERLIGNFLI